ncbi:TetR/AcrR family transcriptional regulator [Actinomadura namibiensis]|uniref:AcrR family transcriptional regulator n=1 Tax=Actinomadura namibiensis TaxID=182080 RepID=A0A7W3QQQ0_ACTNM|nr:TetR/AcrR family transcriptional regulator [Actinomadura namibiensis]MBA8955934.1 AcrR family transcriptional regulator [Actinomadura namibiensis]
MTAAKDADTRERIIQAAARLLADAGGEPVSTRAVCQAAGVGAPTLYHHFGDKRGLLDAVAAYGFERYLSGKRAQESTGDPVEDLRRGWDLHVEFGRTNPQFYALMYGSGHTPPAAREAYALLLGLIEAVARAGRLRVPVGTAARMVGAASVGVTLDLIKDPEAGAEVSARTREAVLTAIALPPGEGDGAGGAPGGPATAARAIALRAALAADPSPVLTGAESALLGEWLERLAATR